MSDEQSSINWGGLVKTILAGVAITAGVMLVAGINLESLKDLLPSGGGMSATTFEGIGTVLTKGVGVLLAYTGVSYLFSDHSQNENAERHAQHFSEAKESFAIREDMRKMQTVMMARMKAAGHEPAVAMGAAPSMG